MVRAPDGFHFCPTGQKAVEGYVPPSPRTCPEHFVTARPWPPLRYESSGTRHWPEAEGNRVLSSVVPCRPSAEAGRGSEGGRSAGTWRRSRGAVRSWGADWVLGAG